MKLARNLALFLICATFVFSAYGQKIPKGKKARAKASDSVAPDKVLYEGAMDKIQHGKYEVARLQLQALLNTYPDSEYLAKAKLGVADSYFKEGGTGNLTLAIDEYKNFIVFFPYVDEAAYAQMQIAMTHYRRLDKPDRDRTEAELAEQEFQTFLQKYPNSPLVAVSEQRLRDVQEMLAEGDFRIATYYDTKKAYKSSMARFTDITNRYPLYSKSDLVLLKLGDLWLKAPLNVPADQKEQMELARKQLAATYYSRIVRDYPLSNLVPKAKERLTSMGVAIPQPDPVALARMQQDQQIPRNRPGIFSHVTGMIHSAPDVSMSARVGSPNMNPPDDNGGSSDPLVPTAGGLNVVGGNATGGATGSGASGGAGATGSTTSDASGSTTGSTAAVQILSTGETAAPGTGAAANPSTTTSTNPPTTTPAGPTPPPPPTTGASGESSSTTAGGSQPPAATTGTAQTPTKAAPNPPCTSKDKRAECKSDSGKESSSRKKGLKKIIPW